MAVLNTTSPTVVPVAPIELPIKTVPSASARMAGGNFPCRDKSTGFSGWLRSPGACRLLAFKCPRLLSDRLLLCVRSGDAVARKAPDYTAGLLYACERGQGKNLLRKHMFLVLQTTATPLDFALSLHPQGFLHAFCCPPCPSFPVLRSRHEDRKSTR